MRKIFLTAFITVISLSSCLKGGGGGCSFSACAQVASAMEIQTIQNYLATNSLTATQHCSGLFYRIDSMGTGSAPDACSNITVTYKAYLTNGTVFDQQTSPIALSLAQTITGWRSAIPLIKAGGRIVLYIPPSLAYGNQNVTDQNGNVVIPANSYLVFEVNLVAVQ
ncbi:MAG TPA: FKBP-type peptidyl-prolyl cis-trans isomerase [Chitinophagaceae bacterium]|nr:FKBP-type peptidyl-prolyl cis-trans isomerase [Chitinophagaceae bacterium]